jgi:flavin reductase (DIM6/NTAB) family NADH-FMN oxidoreductase RutF
MKEELENKRFNRLINHGPVLLLSTAYRGKPNVMALAWQTSISHDPPMLGVAVSPRNHSHRLIDNSGEFVLNIPTVSMMNQVHFCGTNHGNDVDKFRETGLTPVAGGIVSAPLVEECIGSIECQVREEVKVGDHSLFLADVKLVVVERELFDDVWCIEDDELLTLHHLGGEFYAPVGPRKQIEQ